MLSLFFLGIVSIKISNGAFMTVVNITAYEPEASPEAVKIFACWHLDNEKSMSYRRKLGILTIFSPALRLFQ